VKKKKALQKQGLGLTGWRRRPRFRAEGVAYMMDVLLTDEALELLKLLEKGAKHTPEGNALQQLRENQFVMGSPAKTHITQQGVRYLAALKAAAAGNPAA
jgi:hypothetical protein